MDRAATTDAVVGLEQSAPDDNVLHAPGEPLITNLTSAFEPAGTARR
jgi:hypothetical protein